MFEKDIFDGIDSFVNYLKSAQETQKEVLELLKSEIFEIDVADNAIEKNVPNFALLTEKFKPYKVQNDSLEYSILGGDGSRVTIDEEFVFPFYVLKTAVAFEDYKTGKFLKDDKTKIFFEEKDIFDEDTNLLLSDDEINIRMLLEESKFISEHIDIFEPDYIFVDGSLILWGAKKINPPKTENLIKTYERIILKGKENKIPVAGVISASKSKEIIKTLGNYISVKERRSNLDDYLKLIYDVQLMDELLQDWERSPLFISTERLLSYYSEKIYFLFLKTPYEVMRIEIPEYAISETDEICSVIRNQVEKGRGYPMILILSHNEAVIEEKERRFIESIIAKKLEKDKLPTNQKYLSKRMKQF